MKKNVIVFAIMMSCFGFLVVPQDVHANVLSDFSEWLYTSFFGPSSLGGYGFEAKEETSVKKSNNSTLQKIKASRNNAKKNEETSLNNTNLESSDDSSQIKTKLVEISSVDFPRCSDTDGGKNEKSKGITYLRMSNGQTQSFEDSSFGSDGILEYFCMEDNVVGIAYVSCVDRQVKDGVCIEKLADKLVFPDMISVNAQCGASHEKIFSEAPKIELCTKGVASKIKENNGQFLWECSGNNGNNQDCYANVLRVEVEISNTSNPTQTIEINAGDKNVFLSKILLTANKEEDVFVSEINISQKDITENKQLNCSDFKNVVLDYGSYNITGVTSSEGLGCISKFKTNFEIPKGSSKSVSIRADVAESAQNSELEIIPSSFVMSTTNNDFVKWENVAIQKVNVSKKVFNGICGDANNKLFASPPNGDLCRFDTATTVLTSQGMDYTKYTWTCLGINGGTSASCASAENYR